MEDLDLSKSFIQCSHRAIWKKVRFLNFSKYLLSSQRDLYKTDISYVKFDAWSIELGLKSPKIFYFELLKKKPFFFDPVFGPYLVKINFFEYSSILSRALIYNFLSNGYCTFLCFWTFWKKIPIIFYLKLSFFKFKRGRVWIAE